MKKIRRIRSKIVLHPIMTICFLILGVVILSGILTLFNVSVSYNKLSTSGTYVKELVSAENLFSLSGLKFIFSNAVSNFTSFAPLANLLICLMGVGIMDSTGFLDSLFYILTRKVSKKVITFVICFIGIISSIAGDLSYIVLIPLIALLFKYGKRHPKAGVICAFASISCGYGINILMSSIDSSIMNYSLQSAGILYKDYTINSHAYILIMFSAAILLAFILAAITEKVIIPKLGHYELLEEKEDYLTKKEKKGLVLSLLTGIIYIIFFIYNIIPYAPLGGNLIDYSQKLYIDKLFSYDAFFSQGFVFVVTLLFFIMGLTYGLVTKKLKDAKDVFKSLNYSLDKIGKVIVLLFFASSLIFIFKKSNIGTLVTASFANMINSCGFTGIPLFLLLLIASSISTLVLPASVSKWSILSSSAVPAFMNAGMSAEFATTVFRAGECITYAITPLMAYFAIYLAFMELYSVNDNDGLFGSIKHLFPYALFTGIMWFIILILFYLINIPLGINAYPGL